MAKAVITIKLDEKAVNFFTKTSLHQDIPEEAKYVAFFEDGYAQFVEDIKFTGFTFPKHLILSYYDDVDFPDYE